MHESEIKQALRQIALDLKDRGFTRAYVMGWFEQGSSLSGGVHLVVRLHDHLEGKSFSAPTFAQAIAAAQEWLAAQHSFTPANIAATLGISPEGRIMAEPIDLRDSDPSRPGIFRDHDCWRCLDGAEPCRQGEPRHCEFPRARND